MREMLRVLRQELEITEKNKDKTRRKTIAN